MKATTTIAATAAATTAATVTAAATGTGTTATAVGAVGTSRGEGPVMVANSRLGGIIVSVREGVMR